MPRKEFESFTRLDASDVNTYLMDQSVMTFAGTAARGSAIATPVEGMVTYLEDSDAFEYWDSAEWTSLAPAAPSGNAIINGAFEINQRGLTSSTAGGYGFDRWQIAQSGGTVTSSSQAFTLGAAPLSGLESANFQRIVTSGQSAAGDLAAVLQPIESVRTFAGQTVTISFYAKAGSGTPQIGVEINQSFGTGGSPSSAVSTPVSAVTISTSWTRYTATVAVPSISGKTIGTNKDDNLSLVFWVSAGSTFASRASSIGIQNNTFDIWGVQLEAGPTANVFRRNANSIEGELAACQRYAYNPFYLETNANVAVFIGYTISTTLAYFMINLPTTMRAAPSLTWTPTDFTIGYSVGSNANITGSSGGTFNRNSIYLPVTVVGAAADRGYMLYRPGTTANLMITSEL
jgi:hypothetical protein